MSDEPKIGSGKPGPGRPKGVTSKRQAGDLLRVHDVLEAKDYDPIGALIDEARKETDPEKRLAIHYAILPYVYSRQPSVVPNAEADDEDGNGPRGVNVVLKL